MDGCLIQRPSVSSYLLYDVSGLSNVVSTGDGVGCPSDPPIKARDDGNSGDAEDDVRKGYSYAWEMHEDIVCKQLPTVWYFMALPNMISTGEGEGCPL